MGAETNVPERKDDDESKEETPMETYQRVAREMAALADEIEAQRAVER